MFAGLRTRESLNRRLAMFLSLAAHGGLLLTLVHRTAATYVMPREVALGTPYSAGSAIYLAPLGSERLRETTEAQFVRPKNEQAPSRPHKPLARKREEPTSTAAQAPEITAHGGSPYGSRLPGMPITGPAVIPALPEVFPDPAIARADLPDGLEGDVIVEVTIDEQGNVTGLKLTRGLGHGIDEKVLAILQRWHFRPATRNGVSIASQHLVHFHYPS